MVVTFISNLYERDLRFFLLVFLQTSCTKRKNVVGNVLESNIEFNNSIFLLHLYIFKFHFEKLKSWHTNLRCASMSNFESIPSFFAIGAGVNDYENILVKSIVYGIKWTIITKFFFVFFFWPTLFMFYNFDVIFNLDFYRSPTFYDYFPSIDAHWLEKGKHTSLRIIIVYTI